MSEYYHGYTSICSYIRNRNEACSFREFIDLYQEMIIHSPPNTDDWSGLETAWEMRFLRSVKDIIPEKYDDIHSKVKSETSNKSLIYYWQNIINEKGQISVINNHISGSLKILDATAKYNTNTIVSKVLNPREIDTDSSSPNERLKSDEHFMRKKQSISKKNKKSKEQANSKMDEVDVFFQSPSQTECNDDDNSRKMNVYDYEKYEKSYAKLDDSNKWVLTTGTVVEDALYKFGLRCKYEHLAHSFVLDPDDDTYLKENVFTESELSEIRHFQAKETPLMPLDLIKYLNSFNLKTTSEIRKQIFSPDQMDQDFNRSRDFDRDWIRNTIYNLLQEYESNTLTTDHLELWILVHVWSFTDKVFNDIEEVKVVRGESCSLSSSARKNRERTVPGIVEMKRKALGRRGDMIIRKIKAEFGCAEAGRQFEGENGTKLLRERGLKMPKMMKDMFKHLCETFDQDDHKTRQLETIGFLHAGLMMVLLRLDSPAGYVCRVLRSKSFSIATNIKEFGKTLPLISLTWKAKKIVENMISLIEQTNETVDEETDEDQLRRLQDVCDITPLSPRKRKKVDLPTCLDTPSKPSKRVKEIPHDLLGPPPPFNLLSSIVSCPDPQCEGENKVTAKFCSDCGKSLIE